MKTRQKPQTPQTYKTPLKSKTKTPPKQKPLHHAYKSKEQNTPPPASAEIVRRLF